MAFEEQNPLDYRSGGDRVKMWGAKYKDEIPRIYRIINSILTHQQYEDIPVQSDDGVFKIFTVSIEEDGGTTRTERHLAIGQQTGDTFQWVDIGQIAPRFGAPLTSEALTSDDVATQEYEAYKLVKTNENGILPVDVTGSANKISGKIIAVNNLSDGQVLTWRAYDQKWHNENKAAVGEGKALELKNGDTTICVFSGETDQEADIAKWNNVSLSKIADNVADVRYVPTIESTSSTTAKVQKATPEADGRTIAMRDNDGYLLTTTAPTADSSTKNATTANVDAKVSAHNSDSTTHSAAFAEQFASFKLNVLDFRRTSSLYSVGTMVNCDGLPLGYVLECTTQGTTSSTALTLPDPIVADAVVNDGTAIWHIRKCASTNYVQETMQETMQDTLGYRQPSTAYAIRDIAYCSGIPAGWYLECSIAGNTSSGTITLPSPIVENDTFTDGTVTWAIRKINSSVYVPDYERQYPIEVAGDSASDRNVLVLPPMTLNLNGAAYTLPVETEIDADDSDNWDSSTYATKSSRKGLDFYIFACIPSTGIIPVILLSANSTVPTGYNANTSRKIGGFHCECANIGTISGHPLSGYEAGDILPASVWDLKHRAASENEGMVYCAGINKWVDIYLGSWDGSELVSAFGGVIADGTSSPAWHGELFAESMGEIGKSLLWRDEFMCVAKGSNELTNISTSADPNTTGGHTDTGGRRMVSKYGLEDCCGVLWQWGRDMFENWPGSTHNNDNQWLDGYTWSELSVYGTGDSAHYGSCVGFLRRVLLGGHWSDGSDCGSRSTYCYLFSALGGAAHFGVRGASEPRSAGA